MPRSRLTVFHLLAAAGGLLAVAGSFMTWAEVQVPPFDPIVLDGFDRGRDGGWTLAIGLFAVVAVAGSLWPRLSSASAVAAGLAGIALLGVSISDMIELNDDREVLDQIRLFSHPLSDFVKTELGSGLYVVTAGGVLTMLGGAGSLALGWKGGRSPSADEDG